MTAAEKIAAWATALDLDDVPADVAEHAKLHLLDALGCGLAAHATGVAAEGRTTMDELGIRNTTIVRKLDRPRYYLLVQALEGPETTYQLTVAARPR